MSRYRVFTVGEKPWQVEENEKEVKKILDNQATDDEIKKVLRELKEWKGYLGFQLNSQATETQEGMNEPLGPPEMAQFEYAAKTLSDLSKSLDKNPNLKKHYDEIILGKKDKSKKPEKKM